MPEVTSHAPGAPSWAELDTTDEHGALAFYSALFGWEDDPQEITPGWFYHMQKVNGLPACSIYLQSEEERSQNVPPHWNTYLDFTQNPGKVMDDITFVRSHWWLVSEGFSLSTANSDVQKLPATLYHRIADSLAYAA